MQHRNIENQIKSNQTKWETDSLSIHA